MRKPYDLQALMHEMQQSARQGLVSIEDMRRMTDLVLDRLGCTTGPRRSTGCTGTGGSCRGAR
ncbi:hypothetical protein [Streptomyces clavuligerus]|uniref:hypothetical protein n=1 Tax=Streptomyces clavuligerus TaxID=1901 RepID=UPI001E52E847|nr:hypothetical protein [Streptomyces clavuligerus]